jgi:hypothetical protein
MRKCEKIDLEGIEEIKQDKHADYMIDCGGVIVVVEETSRSKLDDVNKIENTINWLRSYKIQNNHNYIRYFLCIVHHERGSDPHLEKVLRYRTQQEQRRKPPAIYCSARCNEGLTKIFSEHKIGL